MPIEDLAVRVTEVLSRAESLFADRADGGAPAAAGRITDAVAVSRLIAPRTADLSGAAATAHTEAMAAVGKALDQAAAAEADLARHLEQANEAHHGGRSHATELRVTAAEVPAALGPAVHMPAGQVAALKALRNRVSRMRDLLARHSAESTRLAGEIRSLGYGR